MGDIVISGGVRYRKQDAERLGLTADQTVTTTDAAEREKTTYAPNSAPDGDGGVISSGGNGDGNTNGAGADSAGEAGGVSDANGSGAGGARAATGTKKGK